MNLVGHAVKLMTVLLHPCSIPFRSHIPWCTDQEYCMSFCMRKPARDFGFDLF